MSRVFLPMAQPDPSPGVACTQCGRCCTYLAVGINAPTTARLATDILWYLYHHGVSVYRDGGGEWSVQFATRCSHLGSDLQCRIYATRPHICRGFDEKTCEVNDPVGGLLFTRPEEFLEYLAERRPRLHRSILGQGQARLGRGVKKTPRAEQPPASAVSDC